MQGLVKIDVEQAVRRSLKQLLRAGLAALVLAGAARADNFTVSPEGVPTTLAAAVERAADGDTIELLAGTYRGGLLLQGRRLTLRGPAEGKPALIQGEPQPVEAKGLWIVRGGEITIENVEFRGARSRDGGGAGVHFDGGGTLHIRHCTFFDNEHGIVAVNDPSAEVTIEASVFGLAPRVVGGLYHLLDIGRIGKLRVTGTRFQQGFEGHLIKSRARETFLGYNFIHDGQRGGASYEVEIAAGGDATLIGNVIGQGADTQNLVVVAYGTEGGDWPVNRLLMSHNTLINYGWTPAWFLRVERSRLPGKQAQVLAVNNLIVGPGIFWLGARGTFEGNRYTVRSLLADADTYAFELPPGSIWRDAGIDPRNVEGHDLAPTAEFQWPVGTRALAPGQKQWTPGAYQR